MKNFKILILLFLFHFFIACNDDVDQDTAFTPVNVKISGTAQKGPFIKGSKIILNELTESFGLNGNSIITKTINDLGNFTLDSIVKAPYFEISVQGKYYNEITGEYTSTDIILNAVYKTDEEIQLNVNALTSLSKKRIIYLIKNEGKTFIDAREQAEEEILKIFKINYIPLLHFNEMDISEEGNDNAVLLALSLILQGGKSELVLQEFISQIASDIEADGVINNTILNEKLIENANYKDLRMAGLNLYNHYMRLGFNPKVPSYLPYLNALSNFKIVWTYPNDFSNVMPTNLSIKTWFNKPLNESTLTVDNLSLRKNNIPVNGEFIHDPELLTVIYSPSELLDPSSNYEFVVTKDLKAIDESSLIEEKVINFETQSCNIEDDLMIYLPFKGDFSNSADNDIQCTAKNVSLTTDRFEIPEMACSFKGVGSIDFPKTFTADSSNWTYSLWFKLDRLPSEGSDAFLLSSHDVFLYVDNKDNMIKSYFWDANNKINSNFVVEKDIWYHAAVVYDEIGIIFYVNGTRTYSGVLPQFSEIYESNFVISDSQGRIYGSIDEVRLYKRNLNDSEIAKLHSIHSK